MSEVVSPADALKGFLGNLPSTIAPITLAHCLSAFDENWFRYPESEYLSRVHLEIDKLDGAVAIYRYAAICGVIEVGLVHMTGFEAKLAQENPEDMAFNRMALQTPLKQRHLASAAEEFRRLRRGVLSPETLARWPAISMGRS